MSLIRKIRTGRRRPALAGSGSLAPKPCAKANPQIVPFPPAAPAGGVPMYSSFNTYNNYSDFFILTVPKIPMIPMIPTILIFFPPLSRRSLARRFTTFHVADRPHSSFCILPSALIMGRSSRKMCESPLPPLNSQHKLLSTFPDMDHQLRQM